MDKDRKRVLKTILIWAILLIVLASIPSILYQKYKAKQPGRILKLDGITMVVSPSLLIHDEKISGVWVDPFKLKSRKMQSLYNAIYKVRLGSYELDVISTNSGSMVVSHADGIVEKVPLEFNFTSNDFLKKLIKHRVEYIELRKFKNISYRESHRDLDSLYSIHIFTQPKERDKLYELLLGEPYVIKIEKIKYEVLPLMKLK